MKPKSRTFVLFNAARLAARTEGFTAAQLQELCRLAAQEAVSQSVERGETEAFALLGIGCTA